MKREKKNLYEATNQATNEKYKKNHQTLPTTEAEGARKERLAN